MLAVAEAKARSLRASPVVVVFTEGLVLRTWKVTEPLPMYSEKKELAIVEDWLVMAVTEEIAKVALSSSTMRKGVPGVRVKVISEVST
jgi:hypothetical protein